MKSTVELVIHAPQSEVAALYCDPRHDVEWMHDVARVEPLQGELGEAGSTYRLVPKWQDGTSTDRGFVATVVARRPNRLDLVLERSDVNVEIATKLVALSADETQLISEEIFTFKGWVAKLFGLLARRNVEQAHRSAMAAFKRFAERQVTAPTDGLASVG